MFCLLVGFHWSSENSQFIEFYINFFCLSIFLWHRMDMFICECEFSIFSSVFLLMITRRSSESSNLAIENDRSSWLLKIDIDRNSFLLYFFPMIQARISSSFFQHIFCLHRSWIRWYFPVHRRESRNFYQYRFYYRDIWTLDDSKLWQRYNNKNNNNNRKQQQQQLWIFHVMTLGNYTMANGMSWGSAVTVHCLNNRIETSYSQWHTIDRGESLMNRTASLALKTQQIGFSYSLATSWVLSFTLFCQFYNL